MRSHSTLCSSSTTGTRLICFEHNACHAEPSSEMITSYLLSSWSWRISDGVLFINIGTPLTEKGYQSPPDQAPKDRSCDILGTISSPPNLLPKRSTCMPLKAKNF